MTNTKPCSEQPYKKLTLFISKRRVRDSEARGKVAGRRHSKIGGYSTHASMRHGAPDYGRGGTAAGVGGRGEVQHHWVFAVIKRALAAPHAVALLIVILAAVLFSTS